VVVVVVDVVVVKWSVVVVVEVVVVVVPKMVVLVVEVVEVEHVHEVLVVVVIVEPVVELVVELVVVLLVVELVVVELLVVVVGPHAGSAGFVQEQNVSLLSLHWLITEVLQALKSAPDKLPHAAVISSAHCFEPQSDGAAPAPETKTPAASVTAANATIALRVIVEPPYGRSNPKIDFDALPPRVHFSTRLSRGFWGFWGYGRKVATRGALGGSGSLQWQAQSKPHAPLFGTPPHVIPGGQVPHLQKLHVRPLSRGSPQGIVSPVQPHAVPIVVQVMPCGQSGEKVGSQLPKPPSPQSAAPQ